MSLKIFNISILQIIFKNSNITKSLINIALPTNFATNIFLSRH